MENQPIFRGIMFCLQRSEKSLFSTENLNGGSGLFGDIDEATCMGDKSGTDEFTDHGGKVGGDGAHSGAEVVVELCAVFGEREDLVYEEEDVVQI